MNIAQLASFPGARRFAVGSVIAKEADTADQRMYIVISGEVGVYKNYEKSTRILTARLHPGDFTGELPLFLGCPRQYTALALTDAVVLAVDRANIADFIKSQPEAVFSLIQTLCLRLGGKAPADGLPALGLPAAQSSAAAPQQSATVPQQPAGSVAQPQRPAANAQCAPVPALFPEGHGDYRLPLGPDDGTYTYEKTYVCPICGKSFKATVIRNSKLVMTGTDKDLRVRYEGVEPLYYDVLTCPGCLYSATVEIFSTGAKNKVFFSKSEELKSAAAGLDFGGQKNAALVFTGYYLALACAPLCFSRSQLIVANLWLKLSRLYSDCGDENLRRLAVQNAHGAYMSAYETLDISESQTAQLCMMIGETACQLGDVKTARTFLFKVKTNKASTPLQKQRAEDRIEDIRGDINA